MKLWPGNPYPLGAHFDGTGTNFSIFSEAATRVELCLFDDNNNETHIDLPEVTGFCWHGYLPDVKPGQRYGYRIHGEWAPEKGHRCNPAKLLIDPYAKAIEGGVTWDEAVFPYHFNAPEGKVNENDSAPYVPKSIVTDTHFDWGDDHPIARPLHETVIYETHVKGLTARHPDIPENLRGTYAGIAHPTTIEYLTNLGITAVELLPVHQFIHNADLVKRGLRNYWGYDSIGFFAPHNEYTSADQRGGQVTEFKGMVKALHSAGIEVILDVVYNHTAEGNHLGPMLSFKGIDNVSYYRLVDGEPRHYMDYTGTGNSLNARHPNVLQLIMDSLRYWVLEMHIDGFRFDLAATLAREFYEVDRLSSFFDVIHQDPVISQVKLIAEPWDVGEGGYQVGKFPPVWSEWNGKYRDCVRDYWRGEDQTLGEFAQRITGSSDLYESTGRRPYASINFLTAHDGFTLNDLVSYNDRHNDANGEDNWGGTENNRSWNCGAEGPTDDNAINDLRAKQKRNFLATLILSQGVPMLLGGDEIGRTQQGNNNAYCQDDEISWYDWENVDRALLEYTQKLIHFLRKHPVFRNRRWFEGKPIHGTGVDDIGWFTLEGKEMAEENWGEGFAKSLAVFLNGKAISNPDTEGNKITDSDFYLIFNAHFEALTFILPGPDWAKSWKMVLNTAQGGFVNNGGQFEPGGQIHVESRSLILLECEE